MSASVSGPKPLFPAPIPGQTMLFPAPSPNHRCDHHNRGSGSLRGLSHSSRCSCDSSYTTPSGFSRLLPALSSNESSVNPSNLTQNEPWLRLPSSNSRFNYDSLLLNSFPLYGKFNGESYPSIDYALLANARRKNATRETTSTLKQWLNEHKKNPYPTKGEKVMLAILTKMTLTQVSTWFANARRRLKKENKMTWSPRKKSGEKKSDDKDDSCSDSDLEGMDVDVDGDNDEVISKGPGEDSINEKTVSSAEVAAINSERPSVIRTLESPTFNEIRDRFKGEPSPVNDLQKWVNGCFEADSNEVTNDYPQELTPPTTPIESKVTTFTSQKLFEAFDAAKQGKNKDNTPPPSIKDDISPAIIFSSKQPVLSTREITTISTSVIEHPRSIPGIITPQPSPKNETEFFIPKPKLDTPLLSEHTMPPILDERITPPPMTPIIRSIEEPKVETNKKPDPVRIQGLTTSRELEAVMALTNLFHS